MVTPITGKIYTKAARGTAADIEKALDAAHAAADVWGKTSATERANILLQIADRIDANRELLAYVETIDPLDLSCEPDGFHARKCCLSLEKRHDLLNSQYAAF